MSSEQDITTQVVEILKKNGYSVELEKKIKNKMIDIVASLGKDRKLFIEVKTASPMLISSILDIRELEKDDTKNNYVVISPLGLSINADKILKNSKIRFFKNTQDFSSQVKSLQ